MRILFLLSLKLLFIVTFVQVISSLENSTDEPYLDEIRLSNNGTRRVFFDKDPNESEPTNASVDDGVVPHSTNTIEFGKSCDRANPEACEHYPTVTCVTDSHRISTCRCTFFRTWIPEHKDCFLNVFSPCSKRVPGEPDLTCGENAFCANDTLGINRVKFCRCRRGFMPKLNQESIPAFCVPDHENPDVPEPLVDYEHGTASLIRQSQLPIILSLIFLPFCPSYSYLLESYSY